MSPAFCPILTTFTRNTIGSHGFIICILIEIATEATAGPRIAAGQCHHDNMVLIIGHLQPKICLEDGTTLILENPDFSFFQGGWEVGGFVVNLVGQEDEDEG